MAYISSQLELPVTRYKYFLQVFYTLRIRVITFLTRHPGTGAPVIRHFTAGALEYLIPKASTIVMKYHQFCDGEGAVVGISTVQSRAINNGIAQWRVYLGRDWMILTSFPSHAEHAL